MGIRTGKATLYSMIPDPPSQADTDDPFWQILPLLLTISPLFSLWESILSKRAAGPSDEPRRIRFTIRHARGLQRPQCELDPFSPEEIAQMDEDAVERLRAPSPFAIVTINEEAMYTTFQARSTHDPEWEEVFDAEVGDLATVVVRVFDRKCIDNGWPAFIGYTTIHPFAVLPYPGGGSREEGEEEDGEATEAVLDDVPLVCEGRTVPGMTISLTLSTDTEEEPTLRVVPPFENAPLETRVERRVGLVKFGKKKVGRKKETTTHVYQMYNLD